MVIHQYDACSHISFQHSLSSLAGRISSRVVTWPCPYFNQTSIQRVLWGMVNPIKSSNSCHSTLVSGFFFSSWYLLLLQLIICSFVSWTHPQPIPAPPTWNSAWHRVGAQYLSAVPGSYCRVILHFSYRHILSTCLFLAECLHTLWNSEKSTWNIPPKFKQRTKGPKRWEVIL